MLHVDKLPDRTQTTISTVAVSSPIANALYIVWQRFAGGSSQMNKYKSCTCRWHQYVGHRKRHGA